jgi:hypothetical protein
MKHSPKEVNMPSFEKFFYEKHGVSLRECPGLLSHVPDDWGRR